MYNAWFMKFAPQAFRDTRIQTTKDVETALLITDNLTNIQPAMIRKHPEILATLRMATCPPIAIDRLVGLAGVSSNLVKQMEREKKLPARMSEALIDAGLARITDVISTMLDPDIFVWLSRERKAATKVEVRRAATVVADRLCGAVASPIIRNAQEKRQLAAIKTWLVARGYRQHPADGGARIEDLARGTFAFHMNVPVKLGDGFRTVNISIDVVVRSKRAQNNACPLFFEAKSAGDFTNTNKRRKEEATKMVQLRRSYGQHVRFNLFLCGYFDSGYLGYEAAEGIDWVWEHRIDDLSKFGL
jgi:hypothetical protein